MVSRSYEKADPLAHGDDFKVIGEEVEIDGRLGEGFRVDEGHFAGIEDRTDEVDHDGETVTLLWDRVVPLERATEHTDAIELKVRLSNRAEGILPAKLFFNSAVVLVSLKVVVDARNPTNSRSPDETGPVREVW